MGRLVRISKILFVILFTILSVLNIFQFKVERAYAADCTTPGPADKLGIYTTTKSDGTRPDQSLDPQSFTVGQISTKLEVEVEDINGCPVKPPATTQVALSLSPGSAASIVDSSGNPASGVFTIATSQFRRAFYLKGASPAGLTITAATQPDASHPQVLNSGTQTATVTTPAPDITKLVFTNNPHGQNDTISGAPGALPTVTGLTARVYTADGLTLLGSGPGNATDGSFAAIATGDDQYRQVLVKVEYTGGFLSNGVLVDQAYPAIVANLAATHDATDRPLLTWTATESGATFRIYRAPSTPTPVLSEAHFLATSTTSSYVDTTAALGTSYRYAVKQVVSGSYTPEFLPTVDSRLDLSNVAISPASPTTTTTPVVSATLTTALRDSALTTPSVLKVQFVHASSGKTYIASNSLSSSNLTLLALAPFTSGSETVSVLPDGSYAVSVIALDSSLGISDSVTITSAYLIDSLAPSIPVLGKLRFSNNLITGLEGSVEGGVWVDVYDQAPGSGATPLTSVLAGATGSFTTTTVVPPVTGQFYLVARDLAGNQSASVLFDVLHAPSAPNASKLSMLQNPAGTPDALIGSAGAVVGNSVVRIYTVNPNRDATLVPFHELVAAADGSFSQEVGDNAAGTFWVASWSGVNLLSSAVNVANATGFGTPTGFTATAGDGNVVLNWNHVSGAVNYTVQIYNASTNELLQTATMSASQTTITLKLTNGTAYKFVLRAVDQYGNISGSAEVSATPQAKKVVVAARASSTKATPPVSTVSSEQAQLPKVSETPTTEGQPPAQNAPPRDWTFLIVLTGVVILGIAGVAAYLLWGREPSETVISTRRTTPTTETTAKKTQTKPLNGDNKEPPKPRW